MHLSSIIWVSIIYLLSCVVAAPTPQPMFIEIHWQAGITGVGPKTAADNAKLATLRAEVKSTMKALKALVTAAHIQKDAESRRILLELANPHASITNIYNFVTFFERYTLRIYEFSFKNVEDRKKTLAHINSGPMSDRMSISESFWKKSIDDQVGIIFHEVSHRGGTVDWWRERSDGTIVPMKTEPLHHKEKDGLLMGYRHRSYWKIYDHCGANFVQNADFWHTLAIYLRRMGQGHVGEDRYPLSLRKSHPQMSQRLTPQLQHAIPEDEPEPTQDNDGFAGVVNAQEQLPFYDQQHIALEGEGVQVAPLTHDPHAAYGAHAAPGTYGGHAGYGPHVATGTPGAHSGYGAQVAFGTHGAHGGHGANDTHHDPYLPHDAQAVYGAHVATTAHVAPDGYDVHAGNAGHGNYAGHGTVHDTHDVYGVQGADYSHDPGVGPSTAPAPASGLAAEMGALNLQENPQDANYGSDGGAGESTPKSKGKGKAQGKKKESALSNFLLGGSSRKGRK